ncbi:MAG: hypothetical protein ACXW2E_00575 [Nitrososphaeraceae archaeon]
MIIFKHLKEGNANSPTYGQNVVIDIELSTEQLQQLERIKEQGKLSAKKMKLDGV